jgi:hypothetical protein
MIRDYRPLKKKELKKRRRQLKVERSWKRDKAKSRNCRKRSIN